MNKINILDDNLITKIAAGEVIERPASVVKELIENSLDAGADEIKIEIINAGLRKIKISDNGSGMNPEDALLSFKRHATSKIKSLMDIFQISSLGFRGEALASVAEISNFSLTTSEGEVGVNIIVEGGKLLNNSKVGSPKGTIIEIKDLFFNVPARKKYLKSETTEQQEITKIVTQYAMINPSVSFRLSNNGQEVLNSPKTDSLLDNVVHVYGSDVGKELFGINFEQDGIKISGFISKPSLTRGTKADQSLYINGRYIKNNAITDAVYMGYQTFLFINRHPLFVLNLEIDPNEVDVNVHPTKREVRLKNEDKVKEVVYQAIKQKLMSSNLIVQTTVEKETDQQPIKNYSFSKDSQQVLKVEAQEKLVENSDSKPTIVNGEKKIIGPFRILGQINKTFVVAESPLGLAIIDQHAVHERINYEKFMKELKDNSIKTQKLVTSKSIELNPAQYQMALQIKEELNKLGFEYSDFGNNTIKLSAIPEIFGSLKSTSFIDVINELTQSKATHLDDEIREKIIRKSCRASIKAGEELSIVQLNVLLDELNKVDNPYSCPHGRPTIIELSVADLEKKFKRSGW